MIRYQAQQSWGNNQYMAKCHKGKAGDGFLYDTIEKELGVMSQQNKHITDAKSNNVICRLSIMEIQRQSCLCET